MAYAQPAVAVATTANINTNSPGGTSTFDNVSSLGAGNRVLLVSQTTTPSENGVWIWHGPTTPMTRPGLGDQYYSTNVLDNAVLIWVQGGDTFAGSCWGIDPAQVITVDTTGHTLTRVVLPPVQARLASEGTSYTLSSAITSVDGITTSSTPPLQGNGAQGSDIILLKDQATPSDNGLYWVNTSGAQARCSEPLIPGRAVIIGGEGATNAHAQYVLPQQGNLVQVGTTSISASRQNVFNVQDFGATGNGTTDDTAAIQATLNCLGSAGGGTCLVPPGTYICSSTLSIPQLVILRGAGPQSSTLSFSNTGDGLARINAVNGSYGDYCYVEDLCIMCTNANNTGAAFDNVDGSYVGIRRCTLEFFSYGVIFDQTEVGHVIDCILMEQTVAGIWLCNGPDHSPGASIGYTNTIHIERNNFTTQAVAIIDDGGDNHVIRRNNFEGGLANTIVYSGVDNLVIEGNEQEGTYGACLVSNGSTFLTWVSSTSSGAGPTTWASSHSYTLGSLVQPTSPNGYVYEY
jgi:hypothetical protein